MRVSEQSQSNAVPSREDYNTTDSVHPICAYAIDPDKCALFVERLEQAKLNIDSH